MGAGLKEVGKLQSNMGGRSWGSQAPRYSVTAGKLHRGVGNEGLGDHGPAVRLGPGASKLLAVQALLVHRELAMEWGPMAEGEPRAGRMGTLAELICSCP